jgi:transcriptional regulator with XRE-family HTH domain
MVIVNLVMAKRDSFVFDAALGARLRELRRRAGLTQLGLAVAMGRQGTGWHVWVSRLELGKYPNPSLVILADYLRACRATFADIADLLDRYTKLPVKAEVRRRATVRAAVAKWTTPDRLAAIKYDVKVAQARERAGRGPEPAEKRAARVVRQQQREDEARQLRRLVVEVINREKLVPGPRVEGYLQAYAAKLARVLRRASPDDRAAAAQAALDEFLSASRLPLDLVRPVHDAVLASPSHH